MGYIFERCGKCYFFIPGGAGKNWEGICEKHRIGRSSWSDSCDRYRPWEVKMLKLDSTVILRKEDNNQ